MGGGDTGKVTRPANPCAGPADDAVGAGAGAGAAAGTGAGAEAAEAAAAAAAALASPTVGGLTEKSKPAGSGGKSEPSADAATAGAGAGAVGAAAGAGAAGAAAAPASAAGLLLGFPLALAPLTLAALLPLLPCALPTERAEDASPPSRERERARAPAACTAVVLTTSRARTGGGVKPRRTEGKMGACACPCAWDSPLCPSAPMQRDDDAPLPRVGERDAERDRGTGDVLRLGMRPATPAEAAYAYWCACAAAAAAWDAVGAPGPNCVGGERSAATAAASAACLARAFSYKRSCTGTAAGATRREGSVCTVGWKEQLMRSSGLSPSGPRLASAASRCCCRCRPSSYSSRWRGTCAAPGGRQAVPVPPVRGQQAPRPGRNGGSEGAVGRGAGRRLSSCSARACGLGQRRLVQAVVRLLAVPAAAAGAQAAASAAAGRAWTGGFTRVVVTR